VPVKVHESGQLPNC